MEKTKSQPENKLNWALLIGLFIFSFSFLFLMKPYVDPQASMDATYYHVMADQLEKGKGFEEPFIWHHLTKFEELIHPTDYWMPLGIVLFYLARIAGGVSAEVILNILIWSFLAVSIFRYCFKLTQNYFASFVSFCIFAFAGKYLYCLLTTDNFAFYAALGYLLLRILGSEKAHSVPLGIICGLIALTRIEGHIFSFFAIIFHWFKTRDMKKVFIVILLFLLTISPWVIRNKTVLDSYWPMKSQVLLMRNYEEIFYEDFEATLSHYLGLGKLEIFRQKVVGLWSSLVQLIAVPAIFLFIPLWLVGLIPIWKREGRFFTFLLFLFWLLCGLVFTLQGVRGTTMHISAFFLPHMALITGVGLDYLNKIKRLKKSVYLGTGIFIILWTITFSLISFNKQSKEYDDDNQPYKDLFKMVSIPQDEKIVSTYPIYVYNLNKNPGVISFRKTGPELLADRYDCTYILMDERLDIKVIPNELKWEKIYSRYPINLYRRKAGS